MRHLFKKPKYSIMVQLILLKKKIEQSGGKFIFNNPYRILIEIHERKFLICVNPFDHEYYLFEKGKKDINIYKSFDEMEYYLVSKF